MTITLNDKEIILPHSLSDFTLGQRIDFHDQYGRGLDDQLSEIQKIKEADDRTIALMDFNFDRMCKVFAFFANTTSEAVKECEFVDEIAAVCGGALFPLLEEPEIGELQRSFKWNDIDLFIDDPEVKMGDGKLFGEFIDSKQLVKNSIDSGSGKWECLLSLCAVYLRKQGEPYQKEFIYPGSERLMLFKDLPMEIAHQVGFFLSSTRISYINTSKYSGSRGLKVQEGIPKSILKDMAG